MDAKQAKNIAKWEEEIKELEKVKRYLKKYQKLKNEKAELDDIHKAGDKLAKILEESKWMKLDWKEIKRSKKNIEGGLEKIAEKELTRKKKIEKMQNESSLDDSNSLVDFNTFDSSNDEEELKDYLIKPVRRDRSVDYTKQIRFCVPGSQLYHWAFGQLTVIAIDGNYVYLKVMDKQGCKPEWAKKNNVKYEVDGKVETLKEFSLGSVGKWLFSNPKDVNLPKSDAVHKFFEKNKK